MAKPKVPNTISDKKMASLRARAAKKTPFNLTDPKQIRARKIGKANYAKRGMN